MAGRDPGPDDVGRQEAPRERTRESRPAATALRGPLLAVVLAATAVRAYEPVIRYDWPSIRGLDHFSHALMAQQMLSHGSYRSYLIYPPGFPTVSAVLSRLSGLPPLVLFPVIAPALLVLTALAAVRAGHPAVGLGVRDRRGSPIGLVLHGAYGSLADGRYPDLTSAYFLITMGVAALLTLYASPSRRSAALAAVLGAVPVLYHSVATLYEGLFLVLAAVTSLPYLLYLRRRTEARTVLAGLAALVVLAIGYGWYTYGVGWPVAGHSASSTAVSQVLGSQSAPAPLHLFSALGAPILWLGVLGLALLVLTLRYERRPAPVLATVTVVCLVPGDVRGQPDRRGRLPAAVRARPRRGALGGRRPGPRRAAENGLAGLADVAAGPGGPGRGALWPWRSRSCWPSGCHRPGRPVPSRARPRLLSAPVVAAGRLAPGAQLGRHDRGHPHESRDH